MKPATAATLAQGDLEVEAGRRAALGGDVDEQSALGRQSKNPSHAKTVTAAAWSAEANNKSYRTDGTYSKGLLPSYGVRLLVLAAEWSPQAFLGG